MEILMPALARNKTAQIRRNLVANLAIRMDSSYLVLIRVTYQIGTPLEQGSSVSSTQNTSIPTSSFHSICSLQSSWL